jgi:hypothetical protein
VVPESLTNRASPAEEQQPLEDHDIEDKADEEYSPPSDTEGEKMYRDVDEVESFRPKLRSSLVGFGLWWNIWASQPPRVPDQGGPASRAGGV